MSAVQYVARFSHCPSLPNKTREIPIYFKGLKYNLLGRCKTEKTRIGHLTVFPMCEQFHSGISPGARFLCDSHSPAITSGSFIIGLLKPDILDDETVSIINDFNIMSGLWRRRRKAYNFVPLLNVQAL